MPRGLTKLHQAGAWTRRRLECVAWIGLLGPALAGAAQLAEPDACAICQVVEAQLEAFAADSGKSST